MSTIATGNAVSKKKADPPPEPKRYGTLIRVSDRFADAIRKVTSLEDVSVAEFADDKLLAIVERAYRAALAKETKRIGEGDA